MIMNFKDAYKSVNDEIHGDRALLHAILNGEAQKKKAFSFHFRPAYTAALAAMFVVAATSVYFGSGINDHTATEERGISHFDTTPSDPAPPIKDEEPIAPDQSSQPKDTYIEDKAAKAIAPQIKEPLTGDSTPEASDTAIMQRQIEPSGVVIASEHDSKPAYSGGGSEDVISNAQYYGEVISALQLPDDLTLLADTEQLASREHCDPLTIVASSPTGERCVTLTFSKQDNLQSLVPDASYACIGEVYAAVEAQGLTQAEIDAIIHADE